MVVTAPGDPGLPQAAVVAGKRVGSAVRRNRAKRRLRAALDRAPLAADTAYVVVAGPAVVDVEFDRLSRWLSGAIAGDRPTSKEEPT
jgi:ribonuclease P protein component